MPSPPSCQRLNIARQPSAWVLILALAATLTNSKVRAADAAAGGDCDGNGGPQR